MALSFTFNNFLLVSNADGESVISSSVRSASTLSFDNEIKRGDVLDILDEIDKLDVLDVVRVRNSSSPSSSFL